MQNMTREDVQELLDQSILGNRSQDKKLSLKFATVKQINPFRIKLDGDSVSYITVFMWYRMA